MGEDKSIELLLWLEKSIFRTENKFDPYMTKDAFVKYISHVLQEECNYKENFKFQNFKVIFGLFLTANVIFSHYHFIPYPDDYYILIACVIIYYITTFIFKRYESKVEGDIFMLYDNPKTKKRYGFGAEMQLFSNILTLQVYGFPQRSVNSKREVKIEDYLDERGYIVQGKMKQLVKEMVKEGEEKTK